jgi:predicted transcriptional regulator
MAALRLDHSMKRLTGFAVLALITCGLLPLPAAALEPGQRAPAFEVQYEGSRVLRSADLAGSIVIITCESKHTTAINQAFKDALLKAFPADERRRLNIVLVPVVACFQYIWPVTGICERGVQDNVARVNLQLYVDISGDMFKNYGAAADTSTVIVIDRSSIVRYVMAGKIPDAEVGSVVELVHSLVENW